MGRLYLDLRVASIYSAAFVTGVVIMSFEMLGSRYLNPYFGSGIYTWAALISTVLAALCVGYFCGGRLADRHPREQIVGVTIVIGSLYLVVLPLFADSMLEAVLRTVDDIKLGSLISAFLIIFLPVVFLGMYTPFAIRLLLRSAQQSGSISGAIYGTSTFGSIVGTLGTTFFLMPAFGSRAITIGMGLAGTITGLFFIFVPLCARKSLPRSAIPIAGLIAGLFITWVPKSHAGEVLDLQVRAALLKQKDGLITHEETEYNDIFITKKDSLLSMAFRRYRQSYTESVSNLSDPDELPVAYTQTMMLGAIYPDRLQKCLMIGLGAGSMPAYLARHVPGLVIDSVELDPGVISAAKNYFGLRETPAMRLIESDGRVFLFRNKEQYDLILVDAFRGGYVPFHLLTKEFYTLLKQHLSPRGVAVFNIHSGTQLYESTLVTLKSVFLAVDLYQNSGSAILIAGTEPFGGPEILAQRAAAVQAQYKFPYPVQTLLPARVEWPKDLKAELLTDDFAPVGLYDATKEKNQRQW